MHDVLGDLRGFSDVFNSVVAEMTDLSRGIMKHVRFKTFEPGFYSRISGDRESRRNPDPDISTTD